MPLLHTDFETFGVLPFGRQKHAVNAERYLSHPQSELLLHQWAVDDGPVQVREGLALCEEFYSLVMDERYTIVAFNAPFERKALKFLCNIDLPPKRFICTMAMAYHFSFAGGLGDICHQVGLADEETKLAEGSRLVPKFTKPRKPTAADPSSRWTALNASADWQLFLKYAELDVVASRALFKWFTYYTIPQQERDLWLADQDINDTGWPLDVELVDRACDFYGRLKTQLLDEMKDLTGLDNPSSLQQLGAWFHDNGLPVENLQREYLEGLLREGGLPPTVFEVLSRRVAVARATPDKFLALQRCMRGGRIRDTLQFAGASRTQRWSGRVFQPQNLYSARSWSEEQLNNLCEDICTLDYRTWRVCYPDLMDALSAAIRPAVTARHGYTLVVVDLSSIESRILGWLCDSARINQIFRDGRDTYKDLATRIFGVPYDEVTKEQRTFSKPPELGCGYMLGGKGLVAYADGMGVEMEEETARRVVRIWRAANPEVENMWEWYSEAALAVVADTTGCTVREGYRVRFRRDDEFLIVDLPSGRSIYYHRPQVVNGRYGLSVEYYGRDDTAGFKGWHTRHTHGGKWVENFDQALARDVLVEALLPTHHNSPPGVRIVGHVHDELVLEAPENLAPSILDWVVRVLSTSPQWAPDLLLDAEGYITKRYMKL